MRKWIVLTVFLVATSLVSIAMNLRQPEPTRGQIAEQLINDGKFAQAVTLMEQLAVENQGNPAIVNTLQRNIAYCKAKLREAHGPETFSIAEPAPPAPPPATSPAKLIDPSTGEPRVPHPAPAPGSTLTLTIKELGNFPFDPVADVTVPADVLALSGARVTLHGFITPFQEADVITDFALTPSLNGCCFGQPAGIEHTIVCHATPERHVTWITAEVVVTGKLIVKPQRENDFTHTIFMLEVESVTAMK